jgi:hypothetical protein
MSNDASTNASDMRPTVNVRVMTGTKGECRPELMKLSRAGIKAVCRNGGVWVAQEDRQAAERICYGR